MGTFSVSYILATSPWFFTRGGYVSLAGGALRNMGDEGFDWSSTASTIVSNAYDLYFRISDTLPSHTSVRWRGYPVRCVGTGSCL